MGWLALRRVEGRVDQELRIDDVWTCGRDSGSEVGAGAVSGDAQPAVRLLIQGLNDGLAVVEPGRERVLRRESVIDGHDARLQPARQCPGRAVRGVQVADHPATAMY